MRNKFVQRRFLIVVGLLAFAAVAVLPAAAQDETLQTACEGLWGDWNADTQKCEAHTTYEIDIEYPVEYAAYDFITGPITDLINTQRDEILGARPYVESPLDPAPGYGLDLSYESFAHSDSVVSLLYTIFANTGGAHPNTYFQTYTFDLNAGTQMFFGDLFPDTDAALNVIAPIAQAQLTEKFGDAADAAWITQGAGPELANYEDFVLTEDSVVFYFEPYQVAAYVFGSSQVEIPLAELADVMTTLE